MQTPSTFPLHHSLRGFASHATATPSGAGKRAAAKPIGSCQRRIAMGCMQQLAAFEGSLFARYWSVSPPEGAETSSRPRWCVLARPFYAVPLQMVSQMVSVHHSAHQPRNTGPETPAQRHQSHHQDGASPRKTPMKKIHGFHSGKDGA